MKHFFHLQVMTMNHTGGVIDYPFDKKYPICKKKEAIKMFNKLKKECEYMNQVKLTKINKNDPDIFKGYKTEKFYSNC